jgi:putative transposase
MTVRDISHHLHRVYGTEVGPDTISTITDEVLDEVKAWQHRPLDEVYPIVYIDALVVKVRDGGTVRNKACYLVVGVGVDGVKHVLGIWVQQRGHSLGQRVGRVRPRKRRRARPQTASRGPAAPRA